MTIRIVSRNPLTIPPIGGGSGAGLNSVGSNLSEIAGSIIAGYRSAANTGPYAVFDTGLNRLVNSGDMTVNSSTSLSSDEYFRQIFTAPASGMTLNGDVRFRQCIVLGAGTSAMTGHSMFNGTGNIEMYDTKIDGRGKSGSNGPTYPSGYGYEQMNPVSNGGFASLHMERTEVTGCTDSIKLDSDFYLGYCWLHGNAHYYPTSSGATHSDHIQIDGTVANSTVEYCTTGTPKSVVLIAGTDKNGSSGPAWSQYEPLTNCGLLQVAVVSSGRTLSNVTHRANYFNDGNYGIQGGIGADSSHAGFDSVTNVLFTANRTGPHHHYGPLNGAVKSAAADGSHVTFDGTNVYDDDFTSYWGGANNGTGGSSFARGQVFA